MSSLRTGREARFLALIAAAGERSYARTTLFYKRVRLMDAWATHCCRTAPADTADNVVALRGQAAD
jgi:hypothetical protein